MGKVRPERGLAQSAPEHCTLPNDDPCLARRQRTNPPVMTTILTHLLTGWRGMQRQRVACRKRGRRVARQARRGPAYQRRFSGGASSRWRHIPRPIQHGCCRYVPSHCLARLAPLVGPRRILHGPPATGSEPDRSAAASGITLSCKPVTGDPPGPPSLRARHLRSGGYQSQQQ